VLLELVAWARLRAVRAVRRYLETQTSHG
jgi:hypothetical protein